MLKFFWPDLKKRSHEPELMDSPDCNDKKLINTVKQFKLINYLFTGSRRLIKKYIINDMLIDTDKEYTLLDIGSGGCDVPIWLIKTARKKKIKLTITSIDYDQRIVDYAKNICANYPEINILNHNALNIDELGKFDYIYSSHFIHHFNIKDIVKLVNLISDSAKKAFILNDIKRSNLSFLGYSLFTLIFMHNSFAFYDGRLSIKKGFMYRDMFEIVDEVKDKTNIKILNAFPGRIVLYGNKI